jgi:hypothetical protein
VVWRTSDHVSILSLGPCNEHTFVVEVELPCAYALMRQFQCKGRGTEVHDSEQEETMYLPGWQESIGCNSQQALVRLHIWKPASLFNDKPAQGACYQYSRLLTIQGTGRSNTFANWKSIPG